MIQRIASDIAVHAHELYDEDKSAQLLFDWLASRQNDAAETSIRRICEKTGMERSAAVRICRLLSDLECCEFIVGRRGGETRIRWKVSLTSLGKAAKGEAVAVEKVDPDLAEEAEQQATAASEQAEAPLTIAEAKRRLALALGVEPAAIDITIRG
jgi:DNA-binding MarR family transcriptional regulator